MSSKEGRAHAANALEVLTTTSLTEAVMAELEAQIVRGDLAPGQRVAEAALAGRLGVSRAPVREACRALVQAGLLIAIRNRGVFVHTIDLAEALELYEVRAVIEAEMAAKLAEHAGPAEISELERLVGEMESRAGTRDPDGYYASNLAFHAFIADHCGNAHMRQIYRSASMKLHIYRRNRLRTETDLAQSNDQHNRLLAAIRAGDPNAARKVMRAHIERNKHWYSDTGHAPGATETPGQAIRL
jgi:DNA-binding GntR family transcriptional regulator